MPNNPFLSGDSISIGNTSVRCADIRLIVAESGLSLSGGELIIWKRNVAITPTRRYVSKDIPLGNAVSFHRWLNLCPHAVGILPDGSLKLPRVDPNSKEDPLQILGDALAVVKHELRRQMMKTASFAVLLFMLGVACIVVTVMYNVKNPNNPGLFRVAVLAIVFIVASVLFMIRAALLLSRGNRIMKVLTSLVTRGELNPEMLAAAVAPSAPSPVLPSITGQPAPRSGPGPIPATLAILGLVCMCCPDVGILLSAIALAITFRQKSWVRTVAVIGVILGILGTAFFIFMASRGGQPVRRHGLSPSPVSHPTAVAT